MTTATVFVEKRVFFNPPAYGIFVREIKKSNKPL